jgi:hypothetical protein
MDEDEPRPKRFETADEMVQALGKFVWNFNILDSRLDAVLGILLNPKDVAVGEIVGTVLTFTNKRLLIKALVSHRPDWIELGLFKAINSQLKKINVVRNDLVHGEQWFDFEGNLKQRRPKPLSDQGVSFKHTEYSPKEVFEWAAKARDLEIEIWQFFETKK